jgi:hypothetical protein
MSETDADRMVRSWRTDAETRGSLIASAVRELSKTGEIGSPEFFRVLSPGLQRSEVMDLYREFQRSGRPDSEWIAEFIEIFPTVTAGELPRPIVDEEEAARFAKSARAEAERRRRESVSGFTKDIPF